MNRNLKLALGGAALSLGVVMGLPTVALANTLDCTKAEIAAKYAERCIPKSQTPVGGGTQAPGGKAGGGGAAGGSTAVGGGTVSSGRAAPGTLPFTGDEILVLGIAGAATLAAGTALTVAGRRRGATTA